MAGVSRFVRPRNAFDDLFLVAAVHLDHRCCLVFLSLMPQPLQITQWFCCRAAWHFEVCGRGRTSTSRQTDASTPPPSGTYPLISTFNSSSNVAFILDWFFASATLKKRTTSMQHVANKLRNGIRTFYWKVPSPVLLAPW